MRRADVTITSLNSGKSRNAMITATRTPRGATPGGYYPSALVAAPCAGSARPAHRQSARPTGVAMKSCIRMGSIAQVYDRHAHRVRKADKRHARSVGKSKFRRATSVSTAEVYLQIHDLNPGMLRRCALGMFEHGLDLVTRHAGEPLEKLIDMRPALEILEERLHRNARTFYSQAPLTLPGTRSTAGHSRQSSMLQR